MEKRINWMHITDLHCGQQRQDILLPKIKHEFFKDIEELKDRLGKIDIVFFTGDLTMSGKKNEFDQLTVFLSELWSIFKKLNCEPLLIAIPGNHDLERPDPAKAAVKVLKGYSTDEELQETLWIDFKNKGEYYEVVKQSFSNFSLWYRNVPIPKPVFKEGLIPGDIASTIILNGIKLNIIGLNTAFLELSNDDYRGKIAINPSQLIELVGDDFISWRKQADFSLLLTHHDPMWYDASSLAYYNNDINPPQAYYTHLCGHLHDADTHQDNIFGSAPRKIQLAPSLFGLQKINGKTDRIHGYYAGSYIYSQNSLHELFHPRKASKNYAGEYVIIPDYGFSLNREGIVEQFYPLGEKEIIKREVPENTDDQQQELGASRKYENILDKKGNNDYAKELEQIPHTNFSYTPSHLAIRFVEQNKFIDLFKREQFIWLITDWGLSEGAFIASVCNTHGFDMTKDSFMINCEDIATKDELLESFETQFSMTLQRFCNLVENLEKPILTFNHLNAGLYHTETAYRKLMQVIQTILDFCPKMHIILIARQVPTSLSIDRLIKLTSLDTIQIKSYIENHPENINELTAPENLLKVEELTGGLPMHIDRLFIRLKVATLDELMETERESPFESRVDVIPKALIHTINSLADSTDRYKQRSFSLLKILTVLSYGEIYGNLKRFRGSEAIYPDNATELEALSLLEVIVTNKVLSKGISGTIQPLKILRVPRQIRDYVNTLITESEREDILNSACILYFGHKWRDGIIRNIYANSILTNSRFYNVDNCHLIIDSILADSIRKDDTHILRNAQIAISFCNHVYDAGDYKNAIRTAEEVYNKLKNIGNDKLKTKIAKILGESLRMLGYRERSITFLIEALENESGGLSNDDKNSIYIDLAYSYLMDGKKDKAIECAKEIEKTAGSKSSYNSIQSRFILAEATLSEDKLLTRLKTLENEARREGYTTLSNTIAVTYADLSKDLKEREKKLTRILQSQGDDYNKMRAVIEKSMDILNHGNGLISDEDLALLNSTYSYLYVQRITNMFKKCHIVLWDYCVNNSRLEDLVNLYKHSSLVWRLTGKDELEKQYFDKLTTLLESEDTRWTEKVPPHTLDYYYRRKLEFTSNDVL
ncbi:MAG: hypothetical protein EAS52_02720 [Parapedobacter sp.]|nr:MAG: hypothetical protein EAS52_02720 [Parapedobacter sp.]